MSLILFRSASFNINVCKDFKKLNILKICVTLVKSHLDKFRDVNESQLSKIFFSF